MNRLAGMLLLIGLALGGCQGPCVVIHPISDQDIIAVKQGQTITCPKNGYFLSAEYVSEVMDAKVE